MVHPKQHLQFGIHDTPRSMQWHTDSHPSCSQGVHRTTSLQIEAMAQSLGKDVQIQLGRPLGQGAFATVYEGVWQGLRVAVKTILFSGSQVLTSPAGPEKGQAIRREIQPRDRAVNEAAVALSVTHPNVVGGVGVGSLCVLLECKAQSAQWPVHPCLLCAWLCFFHIQVLCCAGHAAAAHLQHCCPVPWLW